MDEQGSYNAEHIERLLQCAICLDRYRQPKLLPCQHTFCESPCLEGLVRGLTRSIKCPECRAEHFVPYQGVSAFPNNLTINSFLDLPILRQLPEGDGVEQNNMAAAPAEPARFAAPRYPNFGPAVNYPETPVAAASRLGCASCSREMNLMRCPHCDQILCDGCKTSHMEQVQSDVTRLVGQIRRGIPRLSDAIAHVERKSEQIRQRSESAKSDITETIERYIMELKGRQRLLHSEVEMFLLGEIRSLRMHQENVESEMAEIASFCDSTDATLSRANRMIPDEDLVNIKRQCMEHTENMKSYEDGTYTLPRERSLQFIMEESRLSNAISNFGDVQVNHTSNSQPNSDESDNSVENIPASTSAVADTTSVSTASRYATDNSEILQERYSYMPAHSTSDITSPVISPIQTSYSSSPSRSYLGDFLQRPASPYTSTTRTVSSNEYPSASTSPLMSSLPRSHSAYSYSSPYASIASSSSTHMPLTRSHSSPTASYSSPSASYSAHTTSYSSPPASFYLPPPLQSSSPSYSAPSYLSDLGTLSRITSSPTMTDDSNSSRDFDTSYENSTLSPRRSLHDIRRRNYTTPVAGIIGNPMLSSKYHHPLSAAERRIRSLSTGASLFRINQTRGYIASTRGQRNSSDDGASASGGSRPWMLTLEEGNESIGSGSSRESSVENYPLSWRQPVRSDNGRANTRDDPSDFMAVVVNENGTDFDGNESTFVSEAMYKYENKGTMTFSFGKQGNDAMDLMWPRGVAVAKRENYVFVADSSNHRVQVLDSNGAYVRTFGSYGEGEGEFDSLTGLAVNSFGQIIVADRYNHRIQLFDVSGNFQLQFSQEGVEAGQLLYPWGVACDQMGFIYVCDKENHRIQVFQSNGSFVRKFGSKGKRPGQFHNPHYLAISPDNRIYVSDTSNHRIQVFSMYGDFLFSFGSLGTMQGQMRDPKGIVIDEQGFVVVADSGNNRIQVYHGDGRVYCMFGCYGSGAGEFNTIEGVALLSNGTLVVSDRENHRVQFFSS